VPAAGNIHLFAFGTDFTQFQPFFHILFFRPFFDCRTLVRWLFFDQEQARSLGIGLNFDAIASFILPFLAMEQQLFRE
jgi:hypothetical protein